MIESNLVVVDRGLVTASRLPNKISVPNSYGIFDLGISSLLSFVKNNRNTDKARDQIPNVLVLAKHCGRTNPRAILGVFQTIDQMLKAQGDKHAVLEAAELVIHAAAQVGGGEEAARARAVALICGRSWVYQRIDRLEEAELFAIKCGHLPLGPAPEVGIELIG